MKIQRAWVVLAILLSLLGADLLGGNVFSQEEGKTGDSNVSQAPEWLSGSGKSLRIRLRGTVLDKNGDPATGYKVTVTRNSRSFHQIIKPQVNGSEFDVWIPVNDSDWYCLDIEAVSSDGGQIAFKRLQRYQLRQAAAGGITLAMQAAPRKLEMTVIDQGKPVPGAHVLIELQRGSNKRAQTDQAGVAHLPLQLNDKPVFFHAWTDDFKIGGYSLSEKPDRNLKEDQHVIELTPCRKQEIRFLDEKNAPVANIKFLVDGVPSHPSCSEERTDPNSCLTSDDQGKAYYSWFVDWEKTHTYTTILDKRWVKASREEMVDGTLVVKLKKRNLADRKQVVGQVVSPNGIPGGFLVSLSSLQGEREGHSDMLSTFTDSTGKFSYNVLPNGTYCVFVNDARWVSNTIDGIPYESATQKTTSPTLALTKGTKVEVVLTAGPDKKPIANQSIWLQTPHKYSWYEEGRTQYGVGGRGWSVKTDGLGKATTFVRPGKLEGSVYMEEWTSQKAIEVKEDGSSKLKFHQEINTQRKVIGQLILPAGVEANLADAIIEIGSVDGKSRERNQVTSSQDGSFRFETRASVIGIFAYTKDAKAAGMAIVENFDTPIQVKLLPTRDYHGRLLGKDEKSLVDHAVRASISIIDNSNNLGGGGITSFTAKNIRTTTDQQGNYTLSGLPTQTDISIYADSIDGSEFGVRLGEVKLTSDETRPRVVSRLDKIVARSAKKTVQQRFDVMLRDCRLSDYHLMAIISNPATKSFVDSHFMDRERNLDVYRYMQFRAFARELGLKQEDIDFTKQKNWPIPGEEEEVFACAIDGNGNELGRIQISLNDEKAPEKAAAFITQYAPNRADAKQKWDDAFAEAKRSNRKVWVRLCRRYCRHCFYLTRWLDDQKEFLSKDYVMLSVDDLHDMDGDEITERITMGKPFYLPFFAIFDQDEKRLIDSEGPFGNIAFPRGYKEKKHLRKMLLETRDRMTDEEIEEIMKTVEDLDR